MRHAAGWGCALAFLALCVGLVAFLRQFTVVDGGMLYVEWDTTAIVSAAGDVRPFDPLSGQPELEEGEFFRLSLTLPEDREDGYNLIFELSGAELAVFLDGRELLYSAAELWGEGQTPSSVQIPLPAGGGETLTMDLRPLNGPMGIFPPLLRLTDDPSSRDQTTASASYYALPAGAAALALALLWGLFLLGAAEGQFHWRLLLLLPAAAVLTVYPIATGLLSHEQTRTTLALLGRPELLVFSIGTMAVWLGLHRERSFRKLLGWAVLGSAGALAVCILISHVREGRLAAYFAGLLSQLRSGYWQTPLYWLDLWLLAVCVLLSTWELMRSIVQTRTEAGALALKHQLVMDNYHSLEEKLRQSAALRHEFVHRLAALDALYQEGKLEELGRSLASWRAQSSGTVQLRYTEHTAVNAILQDAAGRAERADIRFEAAAAIPAQVPIPDEDLCALLMNLLDNALEGAAGTPEGAERFIRLRITLRNGFLGVFCANSYGGTVRTDPSGRLRTIKTDEAAHGFGLGQMRAVAEKYQSILDVSYTDTVFTVQTALKLPEEET